MLLEYHLRLMLATQKGVKSWNAYIENSLVRVKISLYFILILFKEDLFLYICRKLLNFSGHFKNKFIMAKHLGLKIDTIIYFQQINNDLSS